MDGAGIDNVAGLGDGSAPIQWMNAMNPLQWSFLQEPAWKWAVFFVAMSLFAVAWKGSLRYMK